ncbi:SDR family NAD(P)-dependent oxidoreductase [Sphingomonas immobilis]|uniref:SDR family oxidoreductase n=1 Tax=Sphingomonas immobilis TaxID=3063997 RepID=A0ABT9A0E4_9SPHN|nr:SDR family oxidoreductase [Sphingomonas sp. CA1-15]MDO7843294.1 SDR family oxidoreductase [Sphingomonas sp. CA1-15]
MTGRLEGKKAIVTGGSRGIGAAIAKRLAAEGADVAITYAGNEEASKQTVAAIGAAGRTGYAVQADAGDAAEQATAIGAAIDKLGGLDILVHNAGVFAINRVDQDDGSFDRLFAVNVAGVQAGTAAAAPRIADGGRIIIIGSVNAHHSIGPGLAPYGASKAAVAGLARGWARDLAARGILVNVVQPGPIDTDMNPADGAMAVGFQKMIPLGRYGKPDEIAALAAFLASDESSFITGTTIDIDGGLSS